MKRILMLLLVAALITGLLTACFPERIKDGSEKLSENLNKTAEKIFNNQKVLEEKLPVPSLDWSNNRANIIKKLETFGSDPNKVSWIHCFTSSGQYVLFTSVKGCVTNLSAYAVPDDQIVDHYSKISSNSTVVVQSPDADGTYGTNGEGIYWFDTKGVYHEWNGLYMLTDQPVQLTVKPLLMMNVEAE